MTKRLFIALLALLPACGAFSQTDSASAQALEADTVAKPDSLLPDSIDYFQQLGEVSITASRRLVKNDVDKLSYDMAHDDEAKTKTTLDMLRKVPMVTVDGQDNVLVNGSSSFKIYRNGHPDPSLNGSNASRVLKAMPANTIKRVEVITDPGAKYDAEGTSVIINIVMKDNAGMQGVAGNVNFGTDASKGTIDAGGNITTQMGKFTLSANYNFVNSPRRAQRSHSHSETLFHDSGEANVTDQRYDGAVKLHYGDISASYEIDSLNLISLSGSGFYVLPNLTGTTSTSRLAADGSTRYSYNSAFHSPHYDQFDLDGRVDFQHKTQLDGEVLTLSYMGQTTYSRQQVSNDYTDLSGVDFGYTGYQQDSKERLVEHTAQVDYVRPLGKLLKLEVGAKYINRTNRSHTTMDYTGTDNGDLDSRFRHTTNVAAGYVEGIMKLGSWSLRAGLRYEYSHMKGSFPDGSAESFSKSLNDWCPSATVQYRFDDLNTLSLNFSTNINRPGISYLNPARIETPTSITEGAPGLNSARYHYLQLVYMHTGRKLTLRLNPQFMFSSNQIASIQGERDGKTWTSYGNVNRFRSFNLQTYTQYTPTTKTTLSLNASVGYQYFQNPNVALSLDGWRLGYSFNLQQQLPWQLRMSAGIGGTCGGHYPSSVYGLNMNWWYHYITLQRSFFNDRFTVMLAASNPFEHKSVYTSRTVQGDYSGLSRSINESQRFGIRLTYRFGSLKARVKTADHSIENNDVVGGIQTQGGR